MVYDYSAFGLLLGYLGEELLAITALMPNPPEDNNERGEGDEPGKPEGHGSRAGHTYRKACFTHTSRPTELDDDFPRATYGHSDGANENIAQVEWRKVRVQFYGIGA